MADAHAERSRRARDKLVVDLIHSGAPQEMIDLAMQGHYGDFTSPLATPITQLVNDANRAGLPSIALAAMDGKYDG